MKELVYGLCDWDDNILHMPTLIKAYDTLLEKHVWLTTEQYATIRNTSHNLTFDSNSFDLFYDYIENNFIIDIERALALETYGPSFKKFIEMVRNGNIIAIITARGHSSATLKKGTIFLIKKIFTAADIEIWHNNLREFRILFNLPAVDDENLEKEYWDQCYFVGLGGRKDQIGTAIRKVEDEKKKAIQEFIKVVYDKSAIIDYKLPIKIGFSDDDKANLEKIHELFIALLNIYPTVKFRLYDTSNRGLKKIIV